MVVRPISVKIHDNIFGPESRCQGKISQDNLSVPKYNAVAFETLNNQNRLLGLRRGDDGSCKFLPRPFNIRGRGD